ncbi:MAG: hypothetical protein IPL39_06030 [Opitutaceae bacterium]|nr:hypothetical protein [Opitutaceae bacterium]
MHPSFVAELRARHPALKLAWERKLRHEPITSPLANPDTLVLLMSRTLGELATALDKRCMEPAQPPSVVRTPRSGCLCGLNPLLAYFRVAASVLPVVMSASADRCPELGAAEYAACLQELLAELHTLAQDEIRSFCAMCQTEIVRGGKLATGSASHSHAAAGK